VDAGGKVSVDFTSATACAQKLIDESRSLFYPYRFIPVLFKWNHSHLIPRCWLLFFSVVLLLFEGLILSLLDFLGFCTTT